MLAGDNKHLSQTHFRNLSKLFIQMTVISFQYPNICSDKNLTHHSRFLPLLKGLLGKLNKKVLSIFRQHGNPIQSGQNSSQKWEEN